MGRRGQRSLHLPCQINAVHRAGEPNVGEDHGDFTPAHQHDCQRSFRAFTLDGVQLPIFE